MQIYPWHIVLQLTIIALHTTTPHLADLVRSIGRFPVKNIDALNTATPNLADLDIYKEQCTGTYGRLTPKLSIYLCKTIKPSKFHILHNADIYPWQIAPIKLGTSNGRSVYIKNNVHIHMAD